ncbi:MAG: penicillin-binding protein activator LpoB [Nitrospirae bacterium]|nr:MAG: penicillin-binding protein activator LpoB [Nitrospirota bacterium]
MGAIAGCTTVTHSPPPTLDPTASYVLLPIVNHTETPLAGRRVEDITASLLQSQGLVTLRRYPPTFIQEASPLASDDRLRQKAVQWAKEQGLRYAFTGAVDEWRYKVGIDGEPAVGVNLELIDLKTDQVVWSAVGAKSGWSREALSGVAQTLLDELLSELEWR